MYAAYYCPANIILIIASGLTHIAVSQDYGVGMHAFAAYALIKVITYALEHFRNVGLLACFGKVAVENRGIRSGTVVTQFCEYVTYTVSEVGKQSIYLLRGYAGFVVVQKTGVGISIVAPAAGDLFFVVYLLFKVRKKNGEIRLCFCFLPFLIAIEFFVNTLLYFVLCHFSAKAGNFVTEDKKKMYHSYLFAGTSLYTILK